MLELDFTEVDLRGMLERAQGLRKDIIDGRWVIEAKHKGGPWEVIVEPDASEKLVVVVTAYESFE